MKHCPPHSEDFCDPYDRICPPKAVCSPVHGKLSVGSPLLTVKGPTVSLGGVNWKDIPTDVFSAEGRYINCSSEKQGDTLQHQVSMSVGTTVTKTKVVETGSTETVAISGEVKFSDQFKVGGSSSLSFNTKTSISNAEAENNTSQKSYNISKPVVVPPMSEVTISHSVIQYTVPIPFSGSIVVDGKLQPNLEGLGQLSAVLPSEKERTFEFAGIINEASLIDYQTVVHQKKLSDGFCRGQRVNYRKQSGVKSGF